MCTVCLETAISQQSRKCPKCRAPFVAATVKNIPINFALEDVMKLLDGSKKSKRNDLPECTEHQLTVSHKCSTHKAWVCQSCIKEDHSSEACKIITISEELDIKKSTQLNQSQPLINKFEETCKKSDDYRKHCKKVIEENDAAIVRLQQEIQRKTNSKLQMEKSYAMFDQKLEMLKGKGSSFEKALASLKSSESIRGVSRCSVEVQMQAENLHSISKEIEKEIESMQQSFNITPNASSELSRGNQRLLASPSHNLK
ncbi:unnamed protein product, partial [Meganyctiphanes norvegica]